MTIKQQFARKEFADKVRSLDVAGLKELFTQLQADDKTDLGVLMFVSRVYGEKAKI